MTGFFFRFISEQRNLFSKAMNNNFFSGSRSTDLRYRIGLAIGYGVPFFISFLTGIVEATAPRCSSIKPRFIEGSCFFSSKSMGTTSTYIYLIKFERMWSCIQRAGMEGWRHRQLALQSRQPLLHASAPEMRPHVLLYCSNELRSYVKKLAPEKISLFNT